ncbi:hypothetical protein G6F24_014552 [Rhizopus arrhizus]|nr:hypothetical protein G6F24_014552 [Rhizopus arrhizus]
MKDDEARHAEHAEQAGARRLPVPIPGAMARASRVMKTIAYRLGWGRAAAPAAPGKAGNAISQVRLREQPAASGSARYRVLLPAAANREEAQATVKRIGAAGLSDYYIISQGEDINAVALGQYRNREGAERRVAAVQAAGFQPRLVASGDAGQWWLEGQLAAGTQPAQAQQRSGAAQSRSLECTRLR